VPVIIVRLSLNLNFLYRFSKSIQISTITKSRPVAAEFFHAGGWTDRHDDDNSRFFEILRTCLKMLFQVQTPSKATEMENFWQFSKSQAFIQKEKKSFLRVINKTSLFDKHGFFEHNSLVSAVAR